MGAPCRLSRAPPWPPSAKGALSQVCLLRQKQSATILLCFSKAFLTHWRRTAAGLRAKEIEQKGCFKPPSVALSQDFRKFEKKSKAGAGKEKLKKISALRGKKSEIPGLELVDTSSMEAFTNSVLLFWRHNSHKFPTWAAAARIMFSMTPNSASAERVFSLLKAMFDDARASSLSDLVQGSLMLKFNKAKRKAEKEMMEQAAGPN